MGPINFGQPSQQQPATSLVKGIEDVLTLFVDFFFV
jgi:hypothetical protein